MEKFEKGNLVKCVNIQPLEGNIIAPKLEKNRVYRVFEVVEDGEGNQHLDVGIESRLNYVRSYETKKHLPDGDSIHWCHPSRFKLLRGE